MTLKLRREHYVRLYLEVNSVRKNQDAGTKILDEFPRPTCRSVYTVSDKRLRHGGSGNETTPIGLVRVYLEMTTAPSTVYTRTYETKVGKLSMQYHTYNVFI